MQYAIRRRLISRPNAARSKPLKPAILALTLIVTLYSLSGFASERFEFLGFDESSLSPEAQDGLREIYSGRMFYSAIPVSLLKAMESAEAERMDELGYDPASVEGKFYSDGSLPSPPNRDAEPGVSLGQSQFERDGAQIANVNCFACHAGVVNGKIIAGLGNNSVMQRPPRPEGDNGPNMMKLASAVTSDAERKAMFDFMARMKALSADVPDVTNRGDNYGPFAVWARGAELADPAKQGLVRGEESTELVKLVQDTMVPPVDPMPWWLMKYKVRDYWYGDGAPTDAAHFSFNFSSSGETANALHESHVASTAKALAFARETQSPLFPGTLDAELVQLGADLFHGRVEPADTAAFKACFECHGTYTKKASDPDFTRPGGWNVAYDGSEELKNVRTDKTYNEVVQKFRPISEHINKLETYYFALESPDLTPYFDHLEGKGYVPPPLVGVWATAPYFHNGSVPTIEGVLNSTLRPEIWARDQSPFAYDLEQLGLQFAAMSREDYAAAAERAASAPYKSKDALDLMFVYDTTGFGRGNMGHTFGDTLTPRERAAIMEFLKSLSGPDM